MAEFDTPPTGPSIPQEIAEVQGVFGSDAALQDAMARLTVSGFDRADLSLPLAHPSRGEATPESGATNPTTSDDQAQARTLHASGAAAVGAMAAVAATLATGGAALAAGAAAVAVGAAAGGIAHGLTRADDNAQHEDREQAAAAGQLVLSARITSATKQAAAEAAMRAAGALRVALIRRANGGLDAPQTDGPDHSAP